MRFKIEWVSTDAQYALARQVDEGTFHVKPGTRLGGVRVKGLSQPRSLLPDGSPDLAVFAFQLVDTSEASLLTSGETVELALGTGN